MCQIREAHNTDLQRYSILNELLSSNQALFYKAGCCARCGRCGTLCTPRTLRHDVS